MIAPGLPRQSEQSDRYLVHRRIALEGFLEGYPQTLVVVDEAYHEYVDAPGLSTATASARAFPNLIVTRTFSKAYGLAGLRIGYMLSHAVVAAVCERLRESFNVNGVALAAAEAALGDQSTVPASATSTVATVRGSPTS